MDVFRIALTKQRDSRYLVGIGIYFGRPKKKETFTVVKDILDKKNIVISNLSALSSLDDVKKPLKC